jgi:hypothetical protein
MAQGSRTGPRGHKGWLAGTIYTIIQPCAKVNFIPQSGTKNLGRVLLVRFFCVKLFIYIFSPFTETFF